MEAWKKGAVIGGLYPLYVFVMMFGIGVISMDETISFQPPHFIENIFIYLSGYSILPARFILYKITGVDDAARFTGIGLPFIGSVLITSMIFWTLIGLIIGFAIDKYRQRRGDIS